MPDFPYGFPKGVTTIVATPRLSGSNEKKAVIVAVPGVSVVTRPPCDTVATDGWFDSHTNWGENVPACVESWTRLPAST
jgi:hypothetical protein